MDLGKGAFPHTKKTENNAPKLFFWCAEVEKKKHALVRKLSCPVSTCKSTGLQVTCSFSFTGSENGPLLCLEEARWTHLFTCATGVFKFCRDVNSSNAINLAN